MSNPAADKSADTVPESSQNNNWNTVQNLLGFLLAGFGAVLSFIGLRSTEVTTVLRNYPDQASLIALFLLLGVLSAVLIVATDTLGATAVSLASAAGIVLMLFGVGAAIIFAIPVGETPGLLSLVIGIALVVVGIAALIYGTAAGTDKKPGVGTAAGTDKKPESTSQDPLARRLRIGLSQVVAGIAALIYKKPESTSQDSLARRLRDPTTVPLSVIFILASVIFIAISAYGAMRLETNSQRSFDAQVVAGVSMNGSGETLSIHVTASRIKNNNYIGISVRGLPPAITLPGQPHAITLAAACDIVGQTPTHSATCPEDPCYWLTTVGGSCQTVMAATVAPNDSGDVDETLNTPLSVGQFQDIHVQAVICSHTTENCFSLSNSGSKLDIFVPTSQTSGNR